MTDCKQVIPSRTTKHSNHIPQLATSRLGLIVTGLFVADVDEQGKGFDHPFEKPRHSTAYLQRAHLILFARDIKVARLEKRLAKIKADFLAEQDRINQHNPSRHVAKRKPSGFSFPKSVGPYKTIATISAAGEVYIKDRTIAALYKSTLQTVKRLTRGRR